MTAVSRSMYFNFFDIGFSLDFHIARDLLWIIERHATFVDRRAESRSFSNLRRRGRVSLMSYKGTLSQSTSSRFISTQGESENRGWEERGPFEHSVRFAVSTLSRLSLLLKHYPVRNNDPVRVSLACLSLLRNWNSDFSQFCHDEYATTFIIRFNKRLIFY